ncbi:MAG: hypothetical protein HY866_18860 [Chloroflexi bacterium]|nr:hypothetical protein [Chloroflexota bacterium]
MRNHKLRWCLILMVLISVLSVGIPAGASGGKAYYLANGVEWSNTCSPTRDGHIVVDLDIEMPAGYTMRYAYTQTSAGVFVSLYKDKGEWTATTAYSYHGPATYWVPRDGTIRNVWELYAPNGIKVTTSRFLANCVTGEVDWINTTP